MHDISKHVKNIINKGYTELKNVLSYRECNRIKSITKKIYKKHSNRTLIKNPLEQTIYNLHNKDPIFLKYIYFKKTFNIIEKCLSHGSYGNKEDIILRQSAVRNPLAGHAQQLHNDTRISGCKYPLAIHIIYMLDDFTKDNGATRIVPKSHSNDDFAKDKKIYKNEKILTGKKGSALIFNASTWHGSSKKNNDDERWGMIFSYSRWFLKSDFDFSKNTPKHIFHKLNLKQKKIMGFCVNPPKDEFSRNSARSVKPENPQNYKLPI